jgi:hypothetical protein
MVGQSHDGVAVRHPQFMAWSGQTLFRGRPEILAGDACRQCLNRTGSQAVWSAAQTGRRESSFVWWIGELQVFLPRLTGHHQQLFLLQSHYLFNCLCRLYYLILIPSVLPNVDLDRRYLAAESRPRYSPADH